MNKILLTISLLFRFALAYSQENDTTDLEIDPNDRSFKKGWLSGHDSWDLQYGILNCDFKNLNTEFIEKYDKTISGRINLIGISTKETFWLNKRSIFDGHFSLQMIQPVKIGMSNSLTLKLQGFILGFDLEKDLFPKSDVFDLLFGIGFNTGRLKLLRKDLEIENKYLKYSNPFFSPSIVIEPKIMLGKISISIKSQYLVDVTNANWNMKDSKLPKIGTSKVNGLMFQGSVGYFF